MKKPPKRLVIKPGRYRTRDGRGVVIDTHAPGKTFEWRGYIVTDKGDQKRDCWRGNGDIGLGCRCDGDLVARLPDTPPKPAKRERLEWGVWIPRASENDCKVLLITGAHNAALRYAKVRRLPMLPATRKET